MINLKLLLLLCFFAVCCLSSDNTHTRSSKFLQEALHHVKRIRTLQDPKRVHTPWPVENCCSLEAVECFRKTLQELKDPDAGKVSTILRFNTTKRSLQFCGGRTNSTTCPSCDSYAQQPLTVFFTGLESLIEKGITRIIMKQR